MYGLKTTYTESKYKRDNIHNDVADLSLGFYFATLEVRETENTLETILHERSGGNDTKTDNMAIDFTIQVTWLYTTLIKKI